MRISVKGGVWKNTEDEILKAAVMKYGKNQWARISSLLTRKSPKQCKARWFEWLDPSIKKTEWSREEDEKLLHLAKLIPTQWRTISPIVGRTPVQCLERYIKLLDEADAGGELGEGSTEAGKDDVRRLRPGEIDPDPETRPARPDPIDMDEDEKEMLSEARARLANTQGKKAKRKAREKQLESARRLATHQKRRELKAAGIEINERKRGRGIDYNADIPFQHKPPPGFWDVSVEVEREEREKKYMTNVLLSRLEGRRRSEIEEEARRKDEEKIRMKTEAGEYIPRSAMKVLKQSDFTERGKMNLPEPQVTIDEINAIVKMSKTNDLVRDLNDGGADMPTRLLLSEYNLNMNSFEISQNSSTQTTFTTESDIKAQARNLKALVETQVPLLDKKIEAQGEIDFKTPLPKSISVLKTGSVTPHIMSGSSIVTNRSMGTSESSQVRGTPLRDKMGINQLSSDSITPVSSDRYGDVSYRYSAVESSSTPVSQQKYISELLKNLPAPENDFEIIVPEPPPEAKSDNSTSQIMLGDGSLKDKTKTVKNKQEEEYERSILCSQVVLKRLPRPIEIESNLILGSEEHKPDAPVHQKSSEPTITKGRRQRKSQKKIKEPSVALRTDNEATAIYDTEAIDKLIKSTMNDMLINDAYNYPAPYQRETPLSSTVSSLDLHTFSAEEIRNADNLIKNELNLIKNSDRRVPLDDIEEFEKARLDIISNYVEHTSDRHKPVKFTDLNSKEKIKIYKSNLLHYRKLAKEGALTARKMESKLVILLSGLQMRSKKLMDNILEIWQNCDNTIRARDSFLHIKKIEDANAGHRIAKEKEMRMMFHSS